jgi:HK97 family phage prohead protease
VSAWDADREKDVIERHAFDATISAWQASGKRLPLLFEHSSVVVGSIDPFSMRATDAGLVVEGEVDRETDQGRQVWRLIKSGVTGFSIGYMSESRPRKGGGRILSEIDLLEISATVRPMHPSARVLDWKSAAPPAR